MKIIRSKIVAVNLVALFTFTPYTIADDLPVDCGEEPTDAIIEYGLATACSFGSRGDIDIFRFAGESQEIVTIRATRTSGTGGDVCIDFYGPDAVTITKECGNPVTLEQTLSQSGTHTLVLDSLSVFDYTLLLERISPPSPNSMPVEYGDILNDKFDFRGDIDFFLFQGSAGDNPIIRATRTSGTGGDACIALFGPRYELIEQQCGNPVTLEPILSQDGVYTLRLEASSASYTFDYILDIQCLFGPCEPILPPQPGNCDLNQDGKFDIRDLNIFWKSCKR